jgi:hypothetical protein
MSKEKDHAPILRRLFRECGSVCLVQAESHR